jgi:hypothetical protein
MMTTISFKRTGGAMGHEIAVDFDLNEMPANISQHLQNLITESNFFATPVLNEAFSRPDEFEYTVTIDAGNSMHTVHTTDTSMPESLRPLIEGLTELAKTAEK